MTLLPPDHPERFALAEEVHARPPEAIEAPARATYLAILRDPDGGDREVEAIRTLCRPHGVAPPEPGMTQWSAGIGEIRVKWERHGEFSAFTFIARGHSPRPFSEPVASMLPAGWLSTLPGRTIVAAHAKVIAAPAGSLSSAALSALFGDNIVVGADIGEGAGTAYTDFRIHADGFARFVLCSGSMTPRQTGRMLQRLFEIEVYRMVALLTLPVARRLYPRIGEVEAVLSDQVRRIAAGDADDENLLQSLTASSAEIEHELTTSQFRFGACRAYHALVLARIAELRERRLPGLQTIDEFMGRRLSPAVAFCATVERRLHEIAERVDRVSALLSTRVEIRREQQNQALLASMDRRARLQLRLQQTVEGLSLAAIVYYVVGLVGYAAKALRAGGVPVDADLTVGVALPVVAVVMLLALRRARRALHERLERPRDPQRYSNRDNRATDA
jgi:uncharacterized membrane-anchored protein